MRSALARFLSSYGQEIVIAGAIIVLFTVVSSINPRFLGANNLNTIISGNAYIAVAAIGAMTTLGGKLETTFTSVANQLK